MKIASPPTRLGAVLGLGLVGAVLAQEIELRLVAADRPDRPVCSRISDFRYSPWGGLIATEWLSGVTLDGKPLFPVRDTRAIGPGHEPSLPVSGGRSGDFMDELDAELAAARKTADAADGLVREADAVDPLYAGKVYPQLKEHREIGPRHVRTSAGRATVAAPALLQPGDLSLGAGADGAGAEHLRAAQGRIEVACYPVRIRAVRADRPERRVPFQPELSWGKRDLLADLHADYSPALPTGAPPHTRDEKGRAVLFYELTVYLLPTVHAKGRSGTAYSLNGGAFHVGKAGVTLADTGGALRQTGPFDLELTLPAEPEPTPPHGAGPFSAEVENGVLRLIPNPDSAPIAVREVRVTAFPPLTETDTGTVRQVRNGRADVGDLAPGLYLVEPAEAGWAPLAICIARAGARGAVSFFTHHNRGDYRQGEQIEVTAVLRALAPVDKVSFELAVTDDAGRETPLGAIAFSAPDGGTDSRLLTIAAAQFDPGRYRLGIRPGGGDWLGHRLVFHVYPRERRTTWEGFSTRICEVGPFRTPEGLCSYHTLLEGPAASLQSDEESARYTGQSVLPDYLAERCRRDPLFPVEEATARYDDQEQELAAAMRFGVDHLPHGAWGMDGQTANWNPKHSYDESLDWMRRMYAQRAQIFREFDSFGGFFMNWYPSLGPHYESHPPAAGFAEFQAAALQKAVRDAQGPIPEGWAWSRENGLFLTRPDGAIVKLNDVLTAGTGHPLFHSATVQELVEWSLRGQRRRTRAFAQAYAAWTEVPRALGNWNYLSFVPVGWFRGPDHYPPLYFESLPRAGIHAYTDWQADPFMELFGIDYYGAGAGKPPWVQMFSGGRAMQIRQTFLAAARGAWGVGCGVEAPVLQGRAGEETRAITDLMNRYGPWFMTMKPVSDVAIVRSFRQEAADTGPFRGSGGRNGMIWFQGLQGELWALYYNLLRSGRPAAFITEEDIAAGALSQYKAVFLHRQRLLMPPDLMKRLDDYAAAGGKVFKDPTTADRYPGETVNLGPDDSIQPEVGSSTHIIGARYLWLLHNYRRCKDRVEAVLARLPPPLARTDHHHLVSAALAGRETAALFVINDTMVPPAVHTAENWFIQGMTLPRQGTLQFDKPCYVYDVTEGGRETHVRSQPYPLDFTRSEGRILVLTERPIRDVRVKADWLTRADGDWLRIEPTVLDDRAQPFSDPLPFEIAVRDPAGRDVKRIYRAGAPGHPVEIAMGRNGPPGDWTVTARELATGREAAAGLSVKAPAAAGMTLLNAGKVLARRPGELARFLAGKKALTVVLDEGQPPAYRQSAEKLAALLRGRGLACDVLEVNPLEVYDLPLRWRRNAYDSNVWAQVSRGERIAVRRALHTLSDQEWAHYDHPDSGYSQPGAQIALFRDVILIGNPRDNRLIADLHQVVNRPATPHSPGPGGALIQVTWDAFAPRFDALSVQVEDAVGLEEGIAWLAAELGKSQAAPPPERVLATGTSSGQAVASPLPDMQRDRFGTPIGAIQPVGDKGDRLVSLSGVGMAGPAHFLLDPTGGVKAVLADMIGGLAPLGADLFLQSWRDRNVIRERDMKPRWQLRDPGRAPPVIRPDTLDVFLGGDNRVLRLDGEGRTVWVRDFTGDARTAADFLRPWKATVHAVSEDGARVLVSGYRAQMYGNIVADYLDPAVMLMDARTGELLWRRAGILVLGSACSFAGERIAACHAGEAKSAPEPRLFLLDGAGRTLLETPLAVKLTRVRPFGTAGLALVEQSGGQGVGLLDLNNGRSVPFPVQGTIKDAWLSGDHAVISTWDGGLHVFDPTLRLVNRYRLASPAGAVNRLADGAGWVVGCENGQVLWLDDDGQVVRTVDLNPFNVMPDEESWARRWFAADLADVPVRRASPWVGRPIGTLDRARPFAGVSESLLKNGDFEQGAAGWTVAGTADGLADDVQGKALRVAGSISQTFACKPGRTYVLSLYQKKPDQDSADGALTVRVSFKGRRETFSAALPLSNGWEERTASFRPPDGATEAVVTLAAERKGKDRPNGAAAEVARVVVSEVAFRSRNMLAQKVEQAPSLDIGDLNLGAGRAGGEVLDEKPPDIKQTIPWIAHLAKASGASEMPPRIITPWFNLVDGKLDGQESSWTGKPVPQGIFSDHASMTVTFNRVRAISLVALYEDPADPVRYTRRFAVFARTGQGLRLLGYRDWNASPYNLFAFDTVETDTLVYIWDGSGDGHVRLMEFEAYSAEADVL